MIAMSPVRLLWCLCLLALVACAMPPRRAATPPVVVAGPSASVPTVTVARGDSDAEIQRRRQTLAAGGSALKADAVGYYMDIQQARFVQLGSKQFGLQRRGNALVLSLPGRLSFDVGSAQLSNDARIALASVAKVLVEYRSTLVSVHGHTDDTGPPASNQTLSEQRATAVARFLADAGVAKQRLIAVGHGASQPLSANVDEKSRERNRRVELRIDPVVR